MARSLVIVESPTKSQTIGRYLEGWRPRRYKVASSVGHIIDLPERELGVDIEAGFEPRYVPAPRKTKVIAELKKLAREAEEILIATDQDREGEAIAWHIANLLGGKGPKAPAIHRVRFNEITRQAIIEAVEHPGIIDQQRVDAQQARRVMDRLVGYQVSPLLWKTVSRGLSAGRVQSVAVRLICEREEEIGAFQPVEYWSIDGTFATAKGELFDASLQKVFADAAEARREAGNPRGGEKPQIGSEAEARAVRVELEAADWRVHSIGEKQVSRKAPPPFITSTLQQDAARRLGFSPKKTMMLAQQLYEGVELGGGETTGLITYMRTDSMRLAESAVEEARAHLAARFGPEILPAKPVVYRGKGKAQDAHEAIRPTSMNHPPERLKAVLGRDALRLYQLIWNRFLACQMVPALYRQRSIDLLGGRWLFRATGSVLVRKGFLEVYEDSKDSQRRKEDEAQDEGATGRRTERPIPVQIAEGEAARLEELRPEQHFTKPPPRYSQESLIKALEELGIGRPSTYASIVDMILKRSYVELKEKRFHPTELGITVNRILVTHFATIFNVDFTARMEEELDGIEAGRDWRGVLGDFYGPFSRALQEAEANRRQIRASTTEALEEPCPECGHALVVKWGRNGRFVACSNFPDCRYTRNPGDQAEPESTDERCGECGAPMQVKTSRYGRFLGCSRYPACRGIKPLDLGLACPREGCDGKLAEKRSKRGRIFYGCTRFPKCDYASWDKPVAQECPSCGHAWMTLKSSEARGEIYTCPRCRTQVDAETLAAGA
jgi:DNA topoisomerase I